MILSICEFWVRMASYDKSADRYDIKHVMGPDEFHEQYPNSNTHGLTNNAYTNIMVAGLFDRVEELVKELDQEELNAAAKKASFNPELFETMKDISRKLRLDINEEGIIGQFSGYFKLSKLNFDAYRNRYGDISRIDRILKGEGKTPDAYQVAKQADTLMAYYELPFDEVDGIIKKMGYNLPENYFSNNLQYYLDRTTHGSTLSRIVYSVLDEMNDNMDKSWQLFSTALFSDYYDIQGGTTAEGIHLGVMGATLQIETQQYGGVQTYDEKISISPHLPSLWKKLKFKHNFRGVIYSFEIDHHNVKVTADKDTHVTVKGKVYQVKKDTPLTVKYR